MTGSGISDGLLEIAVMVNAWVSLVEPEEIPVNARVCDQTLWGGLTTGVATEPGETLRLTTAECVAPF